MGDQAKRWIEKGATLQAGIARRGERRVRWTLSECGFLLCKDRRFEEALQVYDAIVGYRDLSLSDYCNALWVVQEDNTGLPIDAERARRYLAACLPHAGRNPPIRLNAAGVLAELGDDDGVISQLVLAANDGFDVRGYLGERLFAPATRHPRWPEVLAAAAPPARGFSDVLRDVGLEARAIGNPFDGAMWGEYWVSDEIPAVTMVTALLRALDEEDARMRQSAVRLLSWWRDEDGDDGHGGYAQGPLADWYEAIGREIIARVPTLRLAQIIARDLGGPYVRKTAANLSILSCVYGWLDDAPAIIDTLSPVMADHLRTGDWAVRHQLAHALWIFTMERGVDALDDETKVRARLRSECVPVCLSLFEELAALDWSRGFDEDQRNFLFYAVLTMIRLRCAEAAPPLTRLAERAWRTIVEVVEYPFLAAIVDLIGTVREPNALPFLQDILVNGGGAQSHAWFRANFAIGWLHDPRAIDALLVARERLLDPHWKDHYATARVGAALSLLQLGSPVGVVDVIRWLKTDTPARKERLPDALDQLLDAAVRIQSGAGQGAADWHHVSGRLADALDALLSTLAADTSAPVPAQLLPTAAAWRSLA